MTDDLQVIVLLSDRHHNQNATPTFPLRQAPLEQLDGVLTAIFGRLNQPADSIAIVEFFILLLSQLKVVFPNL